MMSESTSYIYKAWDLPARLFHWINFLCIILLSILGLIMLNKGAIGIEGSEAGIGLKTLHVLVGYVFAVNLLFRIFWGFVGGVHSRWKTLVPGKNFAAEFKSYRASLANGQTQTFVGHSPKGKLSVVVLLLLLTFMMFTGLIRAGTDIYFPPFGNMAASFVAAEGVSPADIKPYDKTGTDPDKMAELRKFKSPIGDIHVYVAYILWFLILVHIIAVIRVERSGQGTLISAMFSGKKHLTRPPVDQ
jgi:Ni/Fe-hydrogenase 1 B-type cytochrome subunit